MRTFCTVDSYVVKKMKICVVKSKWTKGGFQLAKKTVSYSVRCLSIVVGFNVFFFGSYGNQPFQNRYSSCLVKPDIEVQSQILNFTTSDPRQDGHS